MNKKIPLSVLDLIPIAEGFTIPQAIENSTKLAQAVEEFGYKRYWVAEHHNFSGIASAATSVILSYIGAKTKKIRIGSGGIMLPNHAPLIIAEQFGTLESLYPNRIDLGLGRAPGTDRKTMLALRRDIYNDGSEFPMMLQELQYYLSNEASDKDIKAVPGYGLDIPIWLLGSSTFSAQLAAQKGLPFVFASHFAPDSMDDAIKIYHANFKPSNQLKEPYVIVCINIVCSKTNEEAQYLATTELQKFLYLQRGDNRQLPKPIKNMSGLWEEWEEKSIRHKARESIWGTPEVVKERLEKLIERTQTNEVMINAMIHNPEDKIKSYELISKIWFD
ncbi:LLM class flavin-dependent oxidoreductase [Poseidonibacter lekithochrous]|uniref:LLM class flavin-dependent oxidoreductase n=1 Tax=Poseidonibacter TaxID=2321187 RepID=UPI001C08F498|nr:MULTISPECIES: LLM class flavin-dependent oxidoreductase [Poseidonibacter]MBU3013180.1 LLM class flavin-dependent oxidoreductase [Poseidonibacter lekithochrous]MDO6826476.1 LLM class flavin-dependent oxidoreductase [Poseidonibacter sp. 1_MG-2023]